MKWRWLIVLLTLITIILTASKASKRPGREELLQALQTQTDPLDSEWAAEWCGILKIKEAVPLIHQIIKQNLQKYYSLDDYIVALGKIGDQRSIKYLLMVHKNDLSIEVMNRIDTNWMNRLETQALCQEFWNQIHDPGFGKSNEHESEFEDCLLFENYMLLEQDKGKALTLCRQLKDIPNKYIRIYLEPYLIKLKDPDVKEKYRLILENGDPKEILKQYERLLFLFTDWFQGEGGQEIKKKCLAWIVDVQTDLDKRRNALSLLCRIIDIKETVVIETILSTLKVRPLVDEWLDSVCFELKYLGERYTEQERHAPISSSVCTAVIGLLGQGAMHTETLQYRAFYCLQAWSLDPVVKTISQILLDQTSLPLKDRERLFGVLVKSGDSELAKIIIDAYPRAKKWAQGKMLALLAYCPDAETQAFLKRCVRSEKGRNRALAEWALFKVQTCAQGPNEVGR